jgi:hypothetical protein
MTTLDAAYILAARGLGLDKKTRARLSRDVAARRAGVTIGTHAAAAGGGRGGGRPVSRDDVRAAVLAAVEDVRRDAAEYAAAADRRVAGMLSWIEREDAKRR